MTLTNLQIEQIINAVSNKVSIKDTAKQFDITPNCIYSMLRRRGLGPGHSRKKVFDFDVFDRNSTEVAYLAGFLYADGNIYKGKRKGYNWALRLCIKDTDLSILDKMCDIINLDKGAIKKKKVYSKKYDKIYNQVYIDIVHENLGKSLERWGIIPNKTYNFVQPQIPKDLLGAFLTGWIDGDGCIHHRFIKNCMRTTFVLVGNRHAIRWFADVVVELGFNEKFRIIEKDEQIYSSFNLYSTKSTLLLMDLLDVERYPYLTRKWKQLIDYRTESTNFKSIVCTMASN